MKIPNALAITVALLLAPMGHGYYVSGVVVDGKAKPLPGVKVFLASDSTQSMLTDSLGRFHLGSPTGIGARQGSGSLEPVFSGSRVSIFSSQPTVVSCAIVDPNGNTLMSRSDWTLRSGMNSLDVRSALSHGAYYFQLSGPGISYRTKLDFDGVSLRPRDAVVSATPTAALARSAAATAADIVLSAQRKYYRSAAATVADGATGIRLTLEKLPNIVMLLSDDQAWTDYGFMGHAAIKTPNLDKLAGQSMLFTRGYVTTSLCRPSIMSISTGLYPHQHGVTGNDPPTGVDRDSMLTFIDKATTLQGLLHKQQGYVTLQTGKWWEGSWQRGQWTSGMSLGDRHGDAGLTIGRVSLDPIPTFLDTAGERPFYLWYAPMLPHQPHNPPKRLLDKYKALTPSLMIAEYWAMVEWFDETIGQVLAELDKRGLRDNTLIFFTTDNGWNQDPAVEMFTADSKNSPFDGGLRSPMMYSWPGKIAPVRDEKTLVTSLDFMPTVLAAAGIAKPANLEGVSLLDGGKAAGTRNKLFGEIFFHNVGDIHDPKVGLRFRWTIQDRMKLIWDRPPAHDSAGLYDIVADPFEKQNLKSASPALVATLKGKLDAWYPVP